MLQHPDRFPQRHNGPSDEDIRQMLDVLGLDSLDELVAQTVPAGIRTDRPLALPPALSERALLDRAHALAAKNEVRRSFIGMGYSGTLTPPPIQRHIFENPNWYTQYTPYQAEIAQGRLEMLLNYQTVVSDLTGLEIANASLLDEGTAAAEAMMMLARHAQKGERNRFFVSERCHPQTIAVVEARATPMGIEVAVGDEADFAFDATFFGALVQYPTTVGGVVDYRSFADAAHEAGFGLTGMVERALLLGGACRAGPCSGRGWAVSASLPRLVPR